MGKSLAYKILAAHLVSGKMEPGEEIGIRIDQTITQDATGTMAYLQFEALGLPRVKTDLSVSYIDHNTLQSGFENADDHRYLQSAAARYGALFSRPGNGICHQVHLERFAVPGGTLLGSDSHTPTSGGLGMIAIGAGGLDVAVAMAGRPYHLRAPKVIGVRLDGKLRPWVSGKDIILELLRRLTVKGGVGSIVEYHGPGVKHLSVPERATCTNMGAELGATTSLFPSDESTRTHLRAQKREEVYQEWSADPDAAYDDRVKLRLSKLEPMVACPHSPDSVQLVREVAGTEVQQVAIGSCTNSSYRDLMTVAAVLRGKTVHPGVSLVVAPGSRQVLEMISRNGALGDLIAAGARILESACGPCIGMGQAPPSGGTSLRTFNRNFPGRSGTRDDRVYLASPEVAAATALAGEITDPRDLDARVRIRMPKTYLADDSLVLHPPERPGEVEVIRGPNIKPVPLGKPLPEEMRARVLLKVEDNITTDHILPAGAKILPFRSNIPEISRFVYARVDPTFAQRAKEAGSGAVVGGENYGQGSSREHAALAPMFLGIRFVLVKSFARIHRANLINFGILPLTFETPSDYDGIAQEDEMEISAVRDAVQGDQPVRLRNVTQGREIRALCTLSTREREIVLAGGLLNHTRGVQRTPPPGELFH